MDHRDSVVVVTGASSGIGNACATYLAKRGYKTYGTCRNPQAYEKNADEFFELVQMDQSDDASVRKAAAAILEREESVRHLVCCAGSCVVGPLESLPLEAFREQMESDFYGPLRAIRAFLPSMRANGGGRILVAGSILGLFGLPFFGAYAAAKHALSGMIQSLRLETAGFGVELCILELGPFRTAFAESRRLVETNTKEQDIYRKSLELTLGEMSQIDAQGADPLVAAKAVYELLGAAKLPPRRVLGGFLSRATALAARLLPAALFEKILAWRFLIPRRPT